MSTTKTSTRKPAAAKAAPKAEAAAPAIDHSKEIAALEAKIQALESKCSDLENALNAAKEELSKPAPASSGNKDPRVDDLILKLNQLVGHLTIKRGQRPDCPRF